MPATKALRKLSKLISLLTLVSNSQTTKGSSRNIRKPLMRCRIDTMPATGSR